jgi:hypothetical protein
MSDPELIELIRNEIREAVLQDREKTVKQTLDILGLDFSSEDDDEISQNKADKIIGRSARMKGKANGTIHFRNKSEGRYGRVMLCRSDVMRIRSRMKS